MPIRWAPINQSNKVMSKGATSCHVHHEVISMPFSLLHMHRGSIKTSNLLTIEMNMLRALHYTLTSKGSSSKGSIVQSTYTNTIQGSSKRVGSINMSKGSNMWSRLHHQGCHGYPTSSMGFFITRKAPLSTKGHQLQRHDHHDHHHPYIVLGANVTTARVTYKWQGLQYTLLASMAIYSQHSFLPCPLLKPHTTFYSWPFEWSHLTLFPILFVALLLPLFLLVFSPWITRMMSVN